MPDTHTRKFSVVVPTYKRPEVLRSTLDSILNNTRKPDEVLIVDDDAIPEALLSEMERRFLEQDILFIYKKKDHAILRRGLSESKNWAVQLAQNEIICFLDDDVVLDTQYFQELMAVWEIQYENKKLIGVGGRIMNNRTTSALEKAYRKLFGLSGECAWDVNDVGFQVWDEGVEKTERAYYIHGGVSSYRRALLIEMPFAVFSGGRTGLEDVEHCLRAKNAEYHFYYVPSAHLMHYPAPAGREAKYNAAKKEGANRKEIFQELCTQDMYHKLWFAWASVGWIGKKILGGKWSDARGLMRGFRA